MGCKGCLKSEDAWCEEAAGHNSELEAISALFQKAYSGDESALKELNNIDCLHKVITADFSQMFLIKRGKYVITENGWFNTCGGYTRRGYNEKIATDLYTLYLYVFAKKEIIFGWKPLPPTFNLTQLYEENKIWSFVSERRTVSGSLRQILRAYSELFQLDGGKYTVELLEKAFFAIPKIDATPGPYKCTKQIFV
jgi:hypothetical protein